MANRNEVGFDFEKKVTDEGEGSSLPSRRTYHRGRNKKRRKKKQNPLLLARMLLVAFIIFVIIVLAYSITRYYSL